MIKYIYSALYYEYHPWDKFYPKAYTSLVSKPNDLKEKKNSILILHGGEDISPSLYNQKPVYTYASKEPSKRDQQEISLINKAIDNNIPIIGICRGAQLLTAVLGGSLIQHVNNHTKNHYITTFNNQKFFVTSAHHQMCIPPKDAQILAWASPKQATRAYTDKENIINTIEQEPEIFIIPKYKALCIQPHPEWMSNQGPFNLWLKEIIEKQRWFD